MNDTSCKKCAVLEPAGTFTHQAAKSYFESLSLPIKWLFSDTRRICKMLKNSEVDYAVLPIENVYKGFVWETLDSMYRTAQIKIVDEIYLRIRQQLMSRLKNISAVKRIYSHEQAFRQSRQSLDALEIEHGTKFQRVSVTSTAEGAKMAYESQDSDASAAIASEDAARNYGLNILKPDIHDAPNNTTRFWVLALREGQLRWFERNKTVFLIELKDEAESLQQFLASFSKRGINLRWLQPLHIEKSGRPTYAFFLEVDGHINFELKDLYSYFSRAQPIFDGRTLRMVGSFPNATPDWEFHKTAPSLDRRALVN